MKKFIVILLTFLISGSVFSMTVGQVENTCGNLLGVIEEYVEEYDLYICYESDEEGVTHKQINFQLIFSSTYNGIVESSSNCTGLRQLAKKMHEMHIGYLSANCKKVTE